MSLSTQLTIEIINQKVALRCLYMASCVVFGYDYVLTFSEEVERIWKRRFTLPTAIFLLLRYITPFELIVSLGVFYSDFIAAFSCNILRIVGVLNITIVTLISCTMTIRIIALYSQNKIILCLLSILMIGQTSVLFAFGMNSKVVHNGQACGVKSSSDLYFTMLWWCPLVTDTIMFFLTVVRLRSLRKLAHQNYSLFHVIMRDGVSYYIVICLMYAFNTINWMLSPESLKVAGVNLGIALPAISICRLTLNLQGVQVQSGSQSDDTSLGVLTTAPSVLYPLPPGSVWLTGERWNSMHLDCPDDSAAEEQETSTGVRQITPT